MDFNDTFVNPANRTDVSGSSAYLLFFQREDLIHRPYSINSKFDDEEKLLKEVN